MLSQNLLCMQFFYLSQIRAYIICNYLLQSRFLKISNEIVYIHIISEQMFLYLPFIFSQYDAS